MKKLKRVDGINKRLFLIWTIVMILTLISVIYLYNHKKTKPDPVTMRTLALKHHLWLGAAVNMQPFLTDAEYKKVLVANYNMITPENVMKFDNIHPSQGRYNFDAADSLVEFATQNNMVIRGHTLVWNESIPDWIVNGNYDDKQLQDILKEHIQTVMKHYKGRMLAWDVANEAFTNEGKMKDKLWKRSIGPDYLELAFRWAHEADPTALLFYNDNYNEEMNSKSDAIYAMIKDFKKKGVPIDGVGFQMHVSVGRKALDQQSFVQNMKRLAELNIQVHITEMDVQVNDSRMTSRETLEKQAEIYGETLQSCLASENCKALTTWGLTDRYTWLSTPSKEEKPLLFDKQYFPKPAYDAMIKVLERSN